VTVNLRKQQELSTF